MQGKLIFILLLMFSTIISAQESKGRFFVETGVKISGGSNYLNFAGKTGFSYNHIKGYYKFLQPADIHSYSYKGSSWSVAPRVGYYLTKRASIGIDCQYFYSNFEYEFENYRISAGGIFARYLFLDKKITPFFEIKSGLGRSKGVEEYVSSGGGSYMKNEYQNLFYFGMLGGFAFKLNDKFGVNISVLAQNTIEKFSDKSNFGTPVFKISNWEVGPLLSLNYVFGRIKD